MKPATSNAKKYILAGIVILSLVYGYSSLMLGPLARREATIRSSIETLEPKLAEAKAQVKATSALEAKAPEAIGVLDQIHSYIPEGEPVAWVPPRIADFFKRQGIEKCTTRLNNEAPEKELPGYRRLFWAIDLPKVEFVRLAIAIAGLENEEPLLQITNIQIESDNEDPQFQHAILTVANIVKS
jgi:hypothetical protein